MSTVYGNSVPNNRPSGRVTFGWIGESFNQFGANAGLWILAALLAIIVPVIVVVVIYTMIGFSIFGAFFGAATSHGSAASGLAAGSLALLFVLFAFLILYQPFLYGGLFRMGVKQARGELLTATDIFSGGPVMLRMLGLGALISVCLFLINIVLQLLLGLAHVIPMAMWAGGRSLSSGASALGAGMFFYLLVVILVYATVYAFVFPAYSLVADGEGVFAALGRSINSVGRDWVRAVGFAVVFSLLYFLSAIPCGLGLIVTVPMLFIISALAYRDVIGMPGLPPPGGTAYGSPQPGVWPPPPAYSDTLPPGGG